jgi:hypothetical protein
MNVIDDFKKYVETKHGDLTKLSENVQENHRRRSELFLDYYEAVVNTFERDIEPMRDIQAQLIEKRGAKMELKKKDGI